MRGHDLPALTPFPVRPGDVVELIVQRLFLPANWLPPFIPIIVTQDTTSLLQLTVSRPKVADVNQKLPSDLKISPRPEVVTHVSKFCWSYQHDSFQKQCSFTEEFLRTVRAVQNAPEPEGPPPPVTNTNAGQSFVLNELWDLAQAQSTQPVGNPEPAIRVETWFLDHNFRDRCYNSRVVLLSLVNFHDWSRSIIQEWRDHVRAEANIEFSLVYPAPETIDPAAVAQVILTQSPQPELRSIVMSIYDSERAHEPPYTFAMTHGSRLTLGSVLEDVRLTRTCPPHMPQNECNIWLGGTAIPPSSQVFVRSGNAFKLRINRGMRLDLQSLLRLPDHLLRQQLQQAIWGEIYQRPGSPPEVEGSSGVAASSTGSPYMAFTPQAAVPMEVDHRPPWLTALNHLYVQFAATEVQEEGPVLYVQTWYVHGDGHLWCREPRPVRLTSSILSWRQDLVQAWSHRLIPHESQEYWVVSAAPNVANRNVDVHVVLSQGLMHNQAAVFFTVCPGPDPAPCPVHAAYILPSRITVNDIVQLLVPHAFRSFPCTVHLRGVAYGIGEVITLLSGDHVQIRYDTYAGDAEDDGTDALGLLQTRVVKTATPLHQDSRVENGVHVLLEDELEDTLSDICDKPLSLSAALASVPGDWVVCAWELPQGLTDTKIVPHHEFQAACLTEDFQTRFGFLAPPSQLFPVNFLRESWHIARDGWHIGSYQVPPIGRAVILTVRYLHDGAVYGVATVPAMLDCRQVRQIFSVTHGTFIRCNGCFASGWIHFSHGDVLEFHAATVHAGIPISLTHARVQLCLEALLPGPSTPFVEDQDASLVICEPDLRSDICSNGSWMFSFLPEGLDLHAATYAALYDQSLLPPSPIVSLELYVDGATGLHTSAWAVVIVALTPHGRIFRGCLSGVTQINPAQADWLGAISHTNIDAELTAMCVATALALFASGDYPICVRPDLSLSRQVAQCQVTSRGSQPIVNTLQALAQMMDDQVNIKEVRAHCSDPWNELADCIAKWTVRNAVSLGSVPWSPLHALAGSRTDCNWNWLAHAPASYQATLPQLYENAVWQPVPPTLRVPVQAHVPTQEYPSYTLDFQVVTFNALALDEADATTRLPGPRSIRVDHQFHHQSCAIIGIQEARTPEGRRVTDHYLILASGFAQCGRTRHHGCELWLHRTLPIAKTPSGDVITLQAFQPVVLVANARVLLVRLQGPFDLHVLVGHAPCLSDDRPLDQIAQWWTDLESVLAQVDKSSSLICCLDANAPLADSITKFYQQHQAEATNRPGALFQDFLLRQELYVPSTFSFHSGDGPTWRHPNGTRLRRDYVLTNDAAFALVDSSWVWYDFDGGFGHQDHYPAVLSFKGVWACTPPTSKLRWDFDKMRDPQARADFESALRTMPLPAWHVDVDTHAQLLETNVVQLAQQHFGKPSKVRHRPILNEATLNGILLKRQALALFRLEVDMHDSLVAAELKILEKDLRPMVRRDQQQWYAHWLEDIDQVASHHDAAQLYRKLQRLGRRKNSLDKGPRPLPQLKDSQGGNATSFEQCQRIWCDQFAALEAGLLVNDAQLQQLHVQLAPGQLCDPSHLMSSHDILAIIRRMKSGKVPGPGLLPIDVLKAGGYVAAQILLPLMTKVQTQVREPLSWKGGLLVPLFKGKGSPKEAASYRSFSSLMFVARFTIPMFARHLLTPGMCMMISFNREAVKDVQRTLPIIFYMDILLGLVRRQFLAPCFSLTCMLLSILLCVPCSLISLFMMTCSVMPCKC